MSSESTTMAATVLVWGGPMTKVKMNNEVQRYTVQAFDSRYVVCTKPFNARRTYLYFVADLETEQRGPCNWPWGLPFVEELNTPEGAQKLLDMFNSGEATHSRRNPPIQIMFDEIVQFKELVK